ncbi:MAG: hypothetical protein J5606_04150 [Bacteroidales bacterium]|nr:hypothetical protein [Bacteroidales bacterium]
MKNKKISAIICLLMLNSYVFAQIQQQTARSVRLQGNPEYMVHTFYTATVQADGSIAQGQTLRTFEYTYNPNGTLKEMKNLTSNGTIRYIYQYQYDTNDNETMRTRFNAARQMEEKRVCNYENKHIASLYIYDKDTAIATKSIYTCNPKGFIEKEDCYQKDKLIKTIVYQRDKNGNMLIQSDQYPDSNTIQIRQCQYNQHNQLVIDIKNDKHGEMVYHNINRYDSQGMLTEQDYQKLSGGLSKKVVFTYDKYQNILSETWYDANDNAFYFNKYTYQYDEQGNWTLKMSYKDKTEILYQIETRAISYY